MKTKQKKSGKPLPFVWHKQIFSICSAFSWWQLVEQLLIIMKKKWNCIDRIIAIAIAQKKSDFDFDFSN